MSSVHSKLNALLAGQAAQNEALAAIATSINNIPGTNVEELAAKVDALNKSVTDLNAEIGNEEPDVTSAPAPAPAG